MAPKSSDVITVYSKDSLEPKKASFIGSFGAEVQTGNIRYLFPEGCEAPKVFVDPIQRAENRKKFVDSLQEEALKSQTERNIESRRSSKKFGDDGENQDDKKAKLRTPSTEVPVILTTEQPAAVEPKIIDPLLDDEAQRGTADLSEPIEELNVPRSNINENAADNQDLSELNKNLKEDELDAEKLQADAPKSNDEGQCCDGDRMKIILPSGDTDSCASSRMAKISIPISAEKLSTVPMKELMNLSSAKSTLIMLQNLQQLVEKYKL